MTSISVAVRIWIKAVLLFSVCIGCIALVQGDFWGLVVAAMAFLFGFMVTLPLLLPIFALVNISKQLSQYSIPARIAWLSFYFMVLFYFYYLLLSKIRGFGEFDILFEHLILSTISVLLVAVLTTRKSLYKLYEPS